MIMNRHVILHALALALGMHLIAGTASARTEVLTWGHADPTGQSVEGFRLQSQRLNAASWDELDLSIDSLTSPESNTWQLEVEVDDRAIVVFKVQAYGGDLESSFSVDLVRYPESTTAEPGGTFLGVYDFANAGEEPANWVDSGAGNSLVANPSLFGPAVLDGDGVFHTGETGTNVHSHIATSDPSEWVNYEYRGRMRVSSGTGSVGFTGYSHYPRADAYYRVRAENGGTFHLAPHPDGAFSMSCTAIDTGVTLTSNTWFSFKMRLQTESAHTTVLAKVWRSDQSEPTDWQIDCFHSESERLLAGTAGVWAMGGGSKYWDDLVIEKLGSAEAPAPEPPPATPPAPPELLE